MLNCEVTSSPFFFCLDNILFRLTFLSVLGAMCLARCYSDCYCVYSFMICNRISSLIRTPYTSQAVPSFLYRKRTTLMKTKRIFLWAINSSKFVTFSRIEKNSLIDLPIKANDARIIKRMCVY